MKFRNALGTLALLTVTITTFSSCTRNDNSSAANSARFQVYLTDDPGNYDKVTIDVRDILINYSSDTASGWTSLANVRTGNYDVLKLVNGKDTMLADADIKTGNIQQIRLVLGSNNTVTVGGQTYPLETPSAQQSGLKLNIHQDVNEGILYKLLMDFDASRSIVKTGNGRFILKPVIRTTLQAVGGSIKGFVLPDSVRTAVYAIKGTDTVGTFTSSGSYMLRGLTAGSYTLSFVPADTTFKATTRTGVNVVTNTVTVADTVRLTK